VLVALLPEVADLRRAQEGGWYRIRSRQIAARLPGGLSRFSHIAFYQPASFGAEKWCVWRYAAIQGVSEVRRIDLIPDEPGHAHAEELYLHLALGEIELLPRPITSIRGRRILFIPTTWEKTALAREINDLFMGSPLEELLHRRLRDLELLPERQHYVAYRDPARDGRPKQSYFLDFALFCRDRYLDIETDGDSYHTGPKAALADNERDNLLEVNGWHILRFNTKQVLNDTEGSLALIREAANRYGGVREPGNVIRRFAPDGRLAPGQGSLAFGDPAS
jgi:hypothetical protein